MERIARPAKIGGMGTNARLTGETMDASKTRIPLAPAIINPCSCPIINIRIHVIHRTISTVILQLDGAWVRFPGMNGVPPRVSHSELPIQISFPVIPFLYLTSRGNP